MANDLDHNPRHTRRSFERGGFTFIELCVVVAIIAILIAMLLPVTRSARPAARRTECKNNLRQIGLALHNYHDAYGSFPPAFTTDADGRPLHSWRTLLLPYLEQKALYDKIDLSRRWDDPVNKEAFDTALHIFCCPETTEPLNRTSYLAVAGPDACFHAGNARTRSDITDHHSKTLAVIEADAERVVPWMSPTDADESLLMSIGPDTKLHHEGGIHVLFVDGDVKYVPLPARLDQLRALISISGNETVTFD